MNGDADASVRRWLTWSLAAIVLAVVVGGATRLTESGLSITEWRPITGVIPPLSHAAWVDAYTRYLAIPEAQSVHLGITLPQFQLLFWWEWVHRLLARGVGLILAVPYFVLLARGRLRRNHRGRLLWLPLLAAAQGALGWYMVQSGLDVRVNVSPYRLTAHLAMALLIFGICLWTRLDLDRQDDGVSDAPHRADSQWLGLGRTVLVCVIITMLSGAFVAGLDAGTIFNTFPLMGDRVVPVGYSSPSLGWRNAFENPIAAQFHHRILALGTAALLLGYVALVLRSAATDRLRRAALRAGGAVLLQVGLGIVTLLLVVPVLLGVLHQATGILVLGTMLVAVHRSRSAPSVGGR